MPTCCGELLLAAPLLSAALHLAGWASRPCSAAILVCATPGLPAAGRPQQVPRTQWAAPAAGRPQYRYHAPNGVGNGPQKPRPGQLTAIMSMEGAAYYPSLNDASLMAQFDVEMTYRLCSQVCVCGKGGGGVWLRGWQGWTFKSSATAGHSWPSAQPRHPRPFWARPHPGGSPPRSRQVPVHYLVSEFSERMLTPPLPLEQKIPAVVRECSARRGGLGGGRGRRLRQALICWAAPR
jgi:hypothetical protein